MAIEHPLFSKYSILIAETDRECQREIEYVLRPAGFRTYITESGIEAIDILNSENIHLLIMDTLLRGMGGLEVFRYACENFPPLPCILLSEHISKEDQINALISHVNTIIPKPLNVNLVKEMVLHLIDRYYI